MALFRVIPSVHTTLVPMVSNLFSHELITEETLFILSVYMAKGYIF